MALTSNLRIILSKYPNFYKSLRKIRFKIWEKKISFQAGFKPLQIKANKIIWVDPNRIEKIGVGWGQYKKTSEFGKIVGGNWDLNTMPFNDLDIHKSFKARFVHGKEWKETSYYQDLIYQIEKGESRISGVKDKEDISRKLNEMDKLFDNIKKNGYKTIIEIKGNNPAIAAMDEITFRIGRNGELLFEDGRHRLSIAKILGIKKIPARVTWRHKGWYLFRQQILAHAKHSGTMKVYQPITHPDLSDIPSDHDETRYKLINSKMDFITGTLLDIGAYWGYFCHKFEDEGFQCYAVERSTRDFYFLNRLRLIEKKKFTAINADIFDFIEKSEFDVVLALNVFHHFLKTSENYKKLVKYLQRIKTKVMFFEPHLPSEAQMENAYHNFDNKQFVNFIIENTGLHKAECIGHVNGGRPIFKLTK